MFSMFSVSVLCTKPPTLYQRVNNSSNTGPASGNMSYNFPMRSLIWYFTLKHVGIINYWKSMYPKIIFFYLHFFTYLHFCLHFMYIFIYIFTFLSPFIFTYKIGLHFYLLTKYWFQCSTYLLLHIFIAVLVAAIAVLQKQCNNSSCR